MRGLRVSLWLLFVLVPATARAGDVNEELISAARKNDLATVKALLDKGADVNAKNRYGATALSYISISIAGQNRNHHTYVAWDLPAPGAAGLLVLAGLAGARRRR